jgi:hypothetical protein
MFSHVGKKKSEIFEAKVQQYFSNLCTEGYDWLLNIKLH